MIREGKFLILQSLQSKEIKIKKRFNNFFFILRFRIY